MRFDPEGDVNFQLDRILNQGIQIQDNVRGALLEVNLAAGENTVKHGLGFIPMGYLVLYSEAESTISGARVVDWTTEDMFMNSSVASPRVRLLVL